MRDNGQLLGGFGVTFHAFSLKELLVSPRETRRLLKCLLWFLCLLNRLDGTMLGITSPGITPGMSTKILFVLIIADNG